MCVLWNIISSYITLPPFQTWSNFRFQNETCAGTRFVMIHTKLVTRPGVLGSRGPGVPGWGFGEYASMLVCEQVPCEQVVVSKWLWASVLWASVCEQVTCEQVTCEQLSVSKCLCEQASCEEMSMWASVLWGNVCVSKCLGEQVSASRF